MAEEQELERMVVKIMGDNSDLKKSFSDAVAMTKSTTKAIENKPIKLGGKATAGSTAETTQMAAAMDEVSVATDHARHSQEGLNVSWMQLHPFLMILRQTTGILEYQAFSVIRLSAHFAELGATVDKSGKAVFGMRSVLAGFGAGAGIIGSQLISGVIEEAFAKMNEKAQRFSDAATQMFDKLSTGTTTLQSELDNLKADELKNGLRDAVRIVTNPTTWEFTKEVITRAFGGAGLFADRIAEAARSAKELDDILSHLAEHPLVKQQLASIGGTMANTSMRKENDALEAQISLMGRGAKYAQQYKHAAQLAASGIMTRAQAEAVLADEIKRSGDLYDKREAQEVKDKTRDLQSELDNIGKSSTEMEKNRLIAEWFKKNPTKELFDFDTGKAQLFATSMEDAREALAGQLAIIDKKGALEREHEADKTVDTLRHSIGLLGAGTIKAAQEQLAFNQAMKEFNNVTPQSLALARQHYAAHYKEIGQLAEGEAVKKATLQIRDLAMEVEKANIEFTQGKAAAAAYAASQKYLHDTGWQMNAGLKEQHANIARLQEIQKIKEGTELPIERYNRRVVQLKDLLGHGLGEKEFVRELAKMRKEIDGNVESLQGALSRGAEGAFRVYAFQEGLRNAAKARREGLSSGGEAKPIIGGKQESPEAKNAADKSVDLLKQIRDYVKKQFEHDQKKGGAAAAVAALG